MSYIYFNRFLSLKIGSVHGIIDPVRTVHIEYDRIIKDSTGMSFSQNIQKLRLRQAERLMQNPNLSIAQISEELGYSAPENFRHVFKKYYGMTPMEYRSIQEQR